MNEKYILVGSGGHSKVIYELACKCNIDVSCISNRHGSSEIPNYHHNSNLKLLTDDEVFTQYSPESTKILLGIGHMPNDHKRQEIYLTYKEKGYKFPVLIHPSAIVPKDADLYEGCQIMSGVILQPDVTIGENTIINTGSSIDHHVTIGDYSHVAPGVTICGHTSIGSGVFIGAGTTIINNIRIEHDTIINAGTTITEDIR